MKTLQLDEFIASVKSNESLAGADLRAVDPFSMDLGGLDLRGADLSRHERPLATGGRFWPFGFAEPYRKARRRVRVRGANLAGARLVRILGSAGDFRDANLANTSFVEADLRDADFTGADLTGADLTGADLAGAKLYAVTHDGTTRWPEGFTPPR